MQKPDGMKDIKNNINSPVSKPGTEEIRTMEIEEVINPKDIAIIIEKSGIDEYTESIGFRGITKNQLGVKYLEKSWSTIDDIEPT